MKTIKHGINYLYSIIASYTIEKKGMKYFNFRTLPWLMAIAFGGILNLLIFPFVRDFGFALVFGLAGGFVLGAIWIILEGFTFNPKVYELDQGVRKLYFLMIMSAILALFIVPILMMQ